MTDSERNPTADTQPGPDDGTNAAASDPDCSADNSADPLGTGVVTIATDRSLESDTTGEAIMTAFKKADHEIVTREHIGTDHDTVQSIVSRLIDRDDIDIVVTGGATGVEPDDVTIEAVEPLLEKELTAFDELFTSLAYEAVGTRVIAARTLAGVTEGTPIFCLPGDESAARLALDEIVLSEARHLVELARKTDDEEAPRDEDADADRAEPETEGE
ncbi:MogA/MoaB family molybdenum cofactor biosynthesis protein [Halopiger djelfimassiliensis]|uniref:MogA/MoaB family molybdenum cofactor biosynthesis protein n=1 Tax=Halopiger djelfimassiliensis TaxID=1293047 RepID=UPI0006778891|nr:molybdopterin-binding protein [Halopiger djelfimassiliensis]